ncbi:MULTISPECIES: HNH endonuclease signature motif containing protein [Acinetobacter]|uniref:HNH endonuclease signature motif containing protein n=1 Tax=Acinetobacter TaxID=469 RepID=UPI0002ED71B4|nr:MULTISPECIES: HNH endonuclease signature motif containing protein [Acinetobacter]
MTLSSGKNSRIKPTENLKIVLFNEVNGLCPKCNKPLMHNNKNQLTKLYEIAHIYPHSAHPHEAELLKNEEKLNDDLDHEDNLIALCRDCHKIFDIPRTIEGYREMIKIKRELQRISRLKNHWYENKLESEINDVINSLVNLTTIATAELSLKAIDFLHKSFFNQFNCLSFTQSKLYMPASKLNRRFNLLRRFLYTQDKILKHFILPNTCST